MLKTAPPVTCSGKHCEKLLDFDSYKGNLCNDCISRLRRRDSRSIANIASRKAGFSTTSGNSSLPTRGRREAPVENMREPPYQQSSSSRLQVQNSEDDSFQTISLNYPKLSLPHLNRSQRISLPIPRRSSPAYRLPSSLLGLARQQEVAAMHFNSRGEFIPMAGSESSSKSVPVETTRDHYSKTGIINVITPVTVPTIPSSSIQPDITPPQPVITNEDDIDTGNIVLSYPYPERSAAPVEATEHLGSSIPHSKVFRSLSADNHQHPDSLLPKKRLKVSHTEIIDLTSTPFPGPRPQPTADRLPSVNRNEENNHNHGSFRTLKLCSMADCTGIVSVDSLSSRCLHCVRREWRANKSRALSIATHRENIPSGSASNHLLTKSAKTKGVTWADELAKKTTTTVDQDPKAAGSPLRISISMGKPNPSQSSTDSSSQKTKLSIVCTSDDDSEIQSLPKIRLSRSSTPNARASERHKGSGRESDLSELSDSIVEDNSASVLNFDSQPKVDHQLSNSQSTLKIRIPPRPNGVYIRQCGAPGCNQLLEPEYRWKSCIMCRARSRDYQRKRQNLQGRHIRLDQELEAHRLGTPLSADIYEEALGEQDVPLVPGARLCSIKNCTFIIPPVGEYHWTMCSLCRACRKEKSRQEKYNFRVDTPDSISMGGETKEWSPRLIVLEDLKHLPLRSEACPPNRCRSVDCGMLLKSKSQKCKQCTARHNWLSNRSRIQHPPRNRVSEQPRRPSLYTQYTCFSALLSDFKSRLAGFLQTQSLFYLFRGIQEANAMFAFDGEFSIVAPNFDLMSRQDAIDAQAQKYKKEVEHIGRMKFKPRRMISILEGGGMAVRFLCYYAVPILAAKVVDNKSQIHTNTKTMQCELEVANLPDNSHPFIPGERVVIRFRLLG